MKNRPAILAIQLAAVAAFIVCTVARAQVAPAATGTAPKLDYDLSYSETALFYAEDTGGAQQRGIASAEAEYENGNDHTPLSLTYSGGYIAGLAGKNTGTGVVQHLLVTQGYAERLWAVNLSDDLGYYPQSPTIGFSGIPGVGIIPGIPSSPTEPVLSLSARSLMNTATPTYERTLNYDTTFSVSGDYLTVRFPDGGGLDINQEGARPQVYWRINALNSISAQYIYSRSSYLGSSFAIETQSVQPGFMRVWNRWISTRASAGPEWVRSNSNFFIPPTLGVAANAEVKYSDKATTASLSYFRSVSAGAGFSSQIGIRTSNAGASISQAIGRNLTAGITGSYINIQGLTQTGVTNGIFGGVNATRRLGEFITLSADYTAIHQTSSQTLQSNALKGLSQVIAFSISYHPRETHLFKK